MEISFMPKLQLKLYQFGSLVAQQAAVPTMTILHHDLQIMTFAVCSVFAHRS